MENKVFFGKILYMYEYAVLKTVHLSFMAHLTVLHFTLC